MSKSLREARDQINDSPELAPEEAIVRAALDGIRPGLLADGGNVELTRVDEDGTVLLQLQGECATCPAQEMTLAKVIEPYLREAVPGVTAVIVA